MSPYLIPAVGFVVGILIGLTGIGGGALMTPILILGLGLPATTAVGTDLFYASLTKIVGSLQHLRQGTVDRRAAILLAAGSVPTALVAISALAVLRRHDAALVETVVRLAIGISLVLASVLLGRRVFWPQKGGQSPLIVRRSRWLVAIGALGGMMVGVSSVGSGSLIIALLILKRIVAEDKIVGTDLTHAVLLVGASAAAHTVLGHVNFGLAGLLLVGSVPGVVLGSLGARRLPVRIIQGGIIVLLLIAALRLSIA